MRPKTALELYPAITRKPNRHRKDLSMFLHIDQRKRRSAVFGFAMTLLVGCPNATDVANDPADASGPGEADMGSSPSDGSADGGQAIMFGNVTFQVHYKKGAGLMWDGRPDRIAGLQQIYDEFSANLRTSGSWDTVIDVCLDEVGPTDTDAYAEALTTSFQTMFRGSPAMATPAWQKITQNVDPNGAVGADLVTGCDFTMRWNFAKGEPSTNPGLTRHETLHGLGAVAVGAGRYVLDTPTVTWIVGTNPIPPTTRVIPHVHELALVDKDGSSLFFNPNASGYLFLTNPVFDPSLTAVQNRASGLRFRGIGDNKGDYFMTIRPSGTPPTVNLEFLHLMELMYGGAGNHPNFNHIAAPDRAWFRAMGYKVAADLN